MFLIYTLKYRLGVEVVGAVGRKKPSYLRVVIPTVKITQFRLIVKVIIKIAIMIKSKVLIDFRLYNFTYIQPLNFQCLL